MNSRTKRLSERTGAQVKGRTKPAASAAMQSSDNTNFAATTVRIDQDLDAWLLAQVQAIHERRLDDLDWENIAEEPEGMAAKDRRALTSFLRVMLTHFLKSKYQLRDRDLHLSSWRASIVNTRREVRDALEESPSLGNEETFKRLFEKGYRDARPVAAAEMGLTDRAMDRLFPK